MTHKGQSAPPINFAPTVTLTYDFEVITPVFGGGVYIDPSTPHQKTIDELTPIRSSAVRGQLRFWWRAATPTEFKSIDAMKAVEDQIWGNASKPGMVSIQVVNQPKIGPAVPVFSVARGNNGGLQVRSAQGAIGRAYGAFSLQPQSEHLRNGGLAAIPGALTTLRGSSQLIAKLNIVQPLNGMNEINVEIEVKAAIEAWLTFGGIGGRTRRGFGAVSDKSSDMKRAERLIASAKTRLHLVPTLWGARLAAQNRNAAPLECLEAGLNTLRTFRQGPGMGRNPGTDNPNRPGRSRWPEPDLIRVLTGQAAPNHRERTVLVDKTPRAKFGMPIIFHFKDRGEPNDQTLKPSRYERMASPVIIRPIRSGSSGQYQPVALRMHVPGADQIELEMNSRRVDSGLSQNEASKIKPLQGNPDTLDAFMKHFARP